MSEVAAFKTGDRVYVTDPALAQLRAIMRNATGVEPAPNHHGTVEEVWDGGNVLIYFDDGGGAPYQVAEVRHLDEARAMTAPTPGTALDTGELRAMVAGMRGPWQTAKGAVVWVNRWQIATFENPSDGQLAAAAVNNLEALLDAADERDVLRARVAAVEAFDTENLIAFVRTFETGEHAANALPIYLRAALATDTTTEDS